MCTFFTIFRNRWNSYTLAPIASAAEKDAEPILVYLAKNKLLDHPIDGESTLVQLVKGTLLDKFFLPSNKIIQSDSYNKRPEPIETLLKYGADKNAKDKSGKGLRQLTEDPQILEILTRYGV